MTWVEAVEPRVLLSASVSYRPQLSDGTLGDPVVFQTGGGSVKDFTPQQVSLLQKGFAAPQYQMFLKVDELAGGSVDSKHKGEIDVVAFNWGGDALTGPGAGVGKDWGGTQELHIAARVSQASPRLIEAMTNGTHFQFADLVVRKGGVTPLEFLTVNADDVLVSSYQVTTARDGALLEEFTLNFAAADLSYTPQRFDGSPGTPVVTHAAGGVEDFAPQQRSLLADGFAAPDGSQYFLSVDGIPGESADDKHKDQLDVLSFGWGGDATLAPRFEGGPAEFVESQYHQVHFVAPMSKASPKLLEAMTRGVTLPTARFSAVGGALKPTEYYVVTLTELLVSSYQVNTTSSGQLVEEFTLDFTGATFEYRPQNADGSMGTAVQFQETGTPREEFKPAQRSLLDAGNIGLGSTSAFLNVAGIPGESRDDKHRGQIDVLSFAWGGDAATARRGDQTPGTLQDLHVVSRFSKASPLILDRLNSGGLISSATLALRKPRTTSDFLTLQLADAVVGSYRVTAASDGTLLEEYTLTFDGADLQYRPQKFDGSLDVPVVFQEQGLVVEHAAAPQQSLSQGGFATSPAVRYFLNVAGIPGESVDSKYKGQIDVLSFAWGGNASLAAPGLTQFHEMHFVAPVSKASPRLMDAMARGTTLDGALLTAVKNDATQLQFLSTSLLGVRVSSYQVVLGAGGQFVEEFTLDFGQAQIDYTEQDASGAAGETFTFKEQGAPVADFKPAQGSLLGSGVQKPTSFAGFLRVDGVPGESADSKHKGEIDILSFSWGGDSKPGMDRGEFGTSALQELHVLSRVSQASPRLMELLDTPEGARDATLSLRRTGKDLTDFYTINLEDVLVSSYRVTTAEDRTLLEEYTLSFRGAGQEYRPQKFDGTYDVPVVFQETGLPVEDFAPQERSVLQNGFAPPAGANLFLTIDGIPGESQDSKHKDAVQVLSFDWGGDAPVAAKGKATFHELHFVSRVSKASPLLLDRMLRGADVADAIFAVQRAGTAQDFLTFSLAGVRVSSYQVTTAADGSVVEEFTLNFQDVSPPETQITGGPPPATNQTSATFFFGGSDAGSSPDQLTFSAELDGGTRFAVASSLQLNNLADGVHMLRVYATDLAGNEDPTPATYTWTVDTLPPTVTGAAFDPAGKGKVTLSIGEGVSLRSGGAGPTLATRSGGVVDGISIAYDAASHSVTIVPAATLPDGDYRLTVPAGWLVDAAGNALAADYTFDFFVLAGDANRDRQVNFSDLAILAQNYNKAGKTWSQGDFNGDGVVNFSDLAILAQHYNTKLPAPAPAVVAPTMAPAVAAPDSIVRDDATATRSVFSTTPVVRPTLVSVKPKAVVRPVAR